MREDALLSHRRHKLRERRIAVGQSIADAAAAAGVATNTWGRFERGLTTPHPHTLDAMRRSVGLTRAEWDAVDDRPATTLAVNGPNGQTLVLEVVDGNAADVTRFVSAPCEWSIRTEGACHDPRGPKGRLHALVGAIRPEDHGAVRRMLHGLMIPEGQGHPE